MVSSACAVGLSHRLSGRVLSQSAYSACSASSSLTASRQRLGRLRRRYDMLAENVRQFREDLAVIVLLEADRRRCRQLLANVEFVNALAMPKELRASSWMFDWTVRALLAVFPVAVLLLV